MARLDRPNPAIPEYNPDAAEDLVECEMCSGLIEEDADTCLHCEAHLEDGVWYRKDEEPPPPIPPLPKDLPDDAELRRRREAVQMERIGWDEPYVVMHARCTWRADQGIGLMFEGWHGEVTLVDVEPDQLCGYCQAPLGELPC